MAKLFSTKTHGVLDYLTAGQLLIMPRMLGWSAGVTMLLNSLALSTLGYSLLTRYELGPFNVLPMKAHLALDGMSGALLCAAPLLFPKESTGVKAALVGLGLFEITAALTTETEPSYREQVDQFTERVLQQHQQLRERALGE
jgi:hypothetical protein